MGAPALCVRTCICLPEDRKPAIQGSTREHQGACKWGGTAGLCCGWPQPGSKQAGQSTCFEVGCGYNKPLHTLQLRRNSTTAMPCLSDRPARLCAGPHHNLWTNLDVGKGTRPFASSGNASRGAHAARLNTWWNIYSSLASAPALKLPECGYGVLENFIGAFGAPLGAAPAGQNVRYPGWCGGAPLSWVVELSSNGAKQFSPADLYSAMLATRSQRLAAVKRG